MAELPFTIPKRVPKWVVEFPRWIRGTGTNDPNLDILETTWTQYQGTHWESFQSFGKTRKRKERDDIVLPTAEDIRDNEILDLDNLSQPTTPAAEEVEKIPPKVKRRLRTKVARVTALADNPTSPEFKKALRDLQKMLL